MMKHFIFSLLLAAMLSCKTENGFAQTNVYPDTGEWFVESCSVVCDNDSLILEMDVDISFLELSTCRSLTFRPMLHTCNEQKVLQGMMLTGRNRTRILERTRILSGGKDSICSDSTLLIIPIASFTEKGAMERRTLLHYRTAVPYEPWMKDCGVTLQQTLRECAGYRRTVYTPLDIEFTLNIKYKQ